MKINKIIYLLVMFCFLTADGMTRPQRVAAFGQYLNRLETISGYRLTQDQRDELERPRTIDDYDPDFLRTSRDLYDTRRNYQDVTQAVLIATWKEHCPGMRWIENGDNAHQLHHIVPLGYGGRNAWWNIFPLTFRDHRQAGSGIHSREDFTTLFPRVN